MAQNQKHKRKIDGPLEIYQLQEMFVDMKDVVKLAYQNTPQGKACMLSPAAASYNTYKNFEERGKDYKTLVMKKTNKQ